MLCPNCKKDMLVLEFELVEIDHCLECGGVWLDSGELALIGKRAGALHGDLLAALESGQGEPQQARPKRRCPLCRKRLLRARARRRTRTSRSKNARATTASGSKPGRFRPSSGPPARTAATFSRGSSPTSTPGDPAAQAEPRAIAKRVAAVVHHPDL